MIVRFYWLLLRWRNFFGGERVKFFWEGKEIILVDMDVVLKKIWWVKIIRKKYEGFFE